MVTLDCCGVSTQGYGKISYVDYPEINFRPLGDLGKI